MQCGTNPIKVSLTCGVESLGPHPGVVYFLVDDPVQNLFLLHPVVDGLLLLASKIGRRVLLILLLVSPPRGHGHRFLLLLLLLLISVGRVLRWRRVTAVPKARVLHALHGTETENCTKLQQS
jgi:hypothetical protein